MTSTQFDRLALAHNDRLCAGPADPAWRLGYWWFNLFRQIRNPDSTGLRFPAQGEFFEIYQMLEPESGWTWPEADPGEFEGANLANPIAQFVFGVDPSLDWEDVRLNSQIPLTVDNHPPADPADYQALGEAQRGAYDPETGAIAAPALAAAQDFFRVTAPYYSPHAKGYGGFFPTPTKLLDHCDDENGSDFEGGAYIPSYQIRFTALNADVSTEGLHGTIGADAQGNPTVTYAGSCPCWTDRHEAGHVMLILEGPFAYYVYVGAGGGCDDWDLDRLPLEDWIPGPYTGEGDLARAEGHQLDRALSWFASDFRGTGAQRTGEFKIRQIAFDNFTLYNRQYPLAPARGREIDGVGVEPIYPEATFTGAQIPAGTQGTWAPGATPQWPIAEGFCIAGVYLEAEGLVTGAAVEILVDGTRLELIGLNPDAGGKAQALKFWAKPPTTGTITVRLATEARLDEGGKIRARLNELMQYQAQDWDRYLILRTASTAGSWDTLDTRGIDFDQSPHVARDLLRYGCIVNRKGAPGVTDQGPAINQNPVYDAARRLARDSIRIGRRQHLQAYEVDAEAVAHLYFQRHCYGLSDADLFRDIAPPEEPVAGNLIEGETYIADSPGGEGRITYEGGSYTHGQTFTATATRDFQAHGDAALYVHDGIRHMALKGGFTNEWILLLAAKCYHPSPTHVYKAEAYADYFGPWVDRCHFLSGTMPAKLRRHTTYGYSVAVDADTGAMTRNPERIQSTIQAPEAPPGYRYALGANQTYYSTQFLKSCQVYTKPYFIQSCTVHDRAAGIVEVTLASRPRSHENAPATVNIDPNAWPSLDVDRLRGVAETGNEDYRTDDNALREYLLSIAQADKPCTWKTGDAGTASSASGLFGACYPQFVFLRLIRRPYDDGNDIHERPDSKIFVDEFCRMEIAQRAMCEGYVDGETSTEIICESGTGGLYDFTWENLNYQAHGNRWVGAVASSLRPDNPRGYGPLPNTPLWAEIYNRLAANVDLLTRAGIDLPVKFKYRIWTYDGYQAVTTSGNPSTGYWLDNAHAPGTDQPDPLNPGDWDEATEFTTLRMCRFQDYGTLWTTREDCEFRVEIDPNFTDAIPSELQELLELNQSGFLANITTTRTAYRREAVELGESDACQGQSGYWASGSEYYRWIARTGFPEQQTICGIVDSGVAMPPTVAQSDYRGSDAYPVCRNIATAQITYALLTAPQAFLRIPLVEA